MSKYTIEIPDKTLYALKIYKAQCKYGNLNETIISILDMFLKTNTNPEQSEKKKEVQNERT